MAPQTSRRSFLAAGCRGLYGLALGATGALGAAGCATTNALQSGYGTALDSIDLESMTDRMAAGIAGSADVQAAIADEGTLKVVVQPVENRMTGEILPRGEAEAFTARVRALLSRHARDQFTWIMNRDTFYS